jgi:hypothetical protein
MSSTDLNNAARRRGGRGTLYATLFLLVLIVGAGLWTWLTLDWSYADGTRAGVLQKFIHRGWICKTQEGDLAQYVVAGVSPQIWKFSVRDPAVSTQLEKIVGARVQLHYTEHPGVPSTCFGDTRYFVDRVTVVDMNPSPLPAAPAPAAPVPQAPAAAGPPGAPAGPPQQ